VIDFLSYLYSLGLSFSALGTARAAVNAYTSMCSGTDFSENRILKNFMKGVFNNRPQFPKHPAVWDVKIVLNFICHENNDSLMFLSCKLCILFLLLSAQRCQTLHLIHTTDVELTDSQVIIHYNHLLKQSRPSFHLEKLYLDKYVRNKKLCVYECFKEYLKRTKALRPETEEKLLISTQAPHRGVAKSTVARWVKRILCQAGIDPSYTTHSTRAVATSVARQKGVSMDKIQKTAGWTNAKTFQRFYNKSVKSDKTVQEAILEK
jgi:integrase